MTASRQELFFISKAFDKVWHEGILYKLKQIDMYVNLLNIITDFLRLRKWVNIESGAHQGSILGPLFFLIYANDLSDDLTSKSFLFADDTSLFSVVQNINSTTTDLNSDCFIGKHY